MRREGNNVIFNMGDWDDLVIRRDTIVKTASQSNRPGFTEITQKEPEHPNSRTFHWVPYEHEFVRKTFEKWDDEDYEDQWK